MIERDELSVIWDYYKARHLHAWNMLVIAFDELEQKALVEAGFETEYAWENVIIRLWLYRAVIRTLLKLGPVQSEAKKVLESFDQNFQQGGINSLKALRDMIEHFDDYAAGKGKGPAKRADDLDPWRTVTRDEYNRGRFTLHLGATLIAANQMRLDAASVSDQFIQWYKSP